MWADAPILTVPDRRIGDDEVLAEEISVQRGLKPEQVPQAAHGYFEAFRRKCDFFGPPGKIIRILCSDLVGLDRALVATWRDEVVGMAACSHDRRSLLQLRLSTLLRELDPCSALMGRVLARFFEDKPAKDELLLDALFVRSCCRGRGVGTMLLRAVCDLARERRLRQVRLQVVDTNPNARRLYERVGFVVQAEERYPWCRRLLGFSSVTTMVKPV